MSLPLRREAERWLEAGLDGIVVEVASVRGSAPREAGTRMLVSVHETAGTIGGGHLELVAMTRARSMLARGEAAPRRERLALGPTLGQCCGGAVELAWSRLDAAALARWPVETPLFRLQLHGAGHVGRAVATLLATLPCEVDWFDQRDDGFPDATTLGSPWPSHVRRLAVETVEHEVASAAPGACFLVLTHEHALDLRIAERILRRGDFAWFGLIGSKTKRAGFERRLLARGVDAAALARMTCPIGLPAIAGKPPAVIAASVVAQLLSTTLRPTSGTTSGRPAEGREIPAS